MNAAAFFAVFGDDLSDHPARRASAAQGDSSTALDAADQSLIARLRTGDREAMSELVVAHFESLARYANTLLRSHDDAEDVAQDVLARVWHNRVTWSPATTIRAYLLGAVRHRVIDLRRRAEAGARRLTLIDAPATSSLPDGALIEREEVDQLHAAVAQLPPRWREVVALRYEQRLPFHEIGHVLGISEDAAKKLAQRAIAELRRMFGV